jgi:hypothetical protein
MLILAGLMLPLVLIEESTEDLRVLELAERISAGIWGAFVLEHAYFLVRARERWRYVRAHWFDLLNHRPETADGVATE